MFAVQLADSSQARSAFETCRSISAVDASPCKDLGSQNAHLATRFNRDLLALFVIVDDHLSTKTDGALL
jgi:hypothetical protein